VTRPRVADDCSTIRARMEELCREPEHEGRQHFPRVTSGPELSGGWIRYCTAPRGPDPNPLLLAILRSSPMMERKPCASEALPPGMMPPWELRR